MCRLFVRIWIFIVILVSVISAQDYSAFIKAGPQYLHFTKLKQTLEETIQRESEFGLKILQSYPMYFSLQLQLSMKSSEKTNLGIYYSRFSTGARASRSDYSGHINLDQILLVDATGFALERLLAQNDLFNTIVSIQMGINFYNLEVITDAYLLGSYSVSKDEIYSIAFHFSPLLILEKNFSPLILRVDFGLIADIGVNFYGPGDFDINFGGLTPSAIGFNTNFSIGLEF